MPRMLFSLAVAVMFGFAGEVFALDAGIDCAEGADEDLVAEEQATEPAKPPTKPVRRITPFPAMTFGVAAYAS